MNTDGRNDLKPGTAMASESGDEEDELISNTRPSGYRPLPPTTRESLLAALGRFDHEMRESTAWQGWQDKQNHKYAIRYEDALYPVKKIIQLAIGPGCPGFGGGKVANGYVARYGFETVPLRTSPPAQPVSFWWVNQGDSHQTESAGGYIFASPATVAARINVLKVKPGDVIFHCAKQHIYAVSEVTHPPRKNAARPNRPGEGLGYLAYTRYHLLTEPIVVPGI